MSGNKPARKNPGVENMEAGNRDDSLMTDRKHTFPSTIAP